MDRLSSRQLVIAVALAFAGTGAFAHGTKQTTASDATGSATVSTDSSVKGTSSGVTTSADAATTPNYSGNMGVKSTPGAADEDQNDEGGARGKAKAHSGKRKHDAASTAPATEASSGSSPATSSNATTR